MIRGRRGPATRSSGARSGLLSSGLLSSGSLWSGHLALPRGLLFASLLSLATTSLGCAVHVAEPVDPLREARVSASDSTEGEALGRWLLLELVAPGGQAAQAQAARARLDKVAADDRGLFASLARAVDDEAHGNLNRAFRGYLEATKAARKHPGPEASLLAHFATTHLLRLRPAAQITWTAERPFLEEALAEPQGLGFRARGDLAEWWAFDARRAGEMSGTELLASESARLGCLTQGRIAGPFGATRPVDMVTAFEAETPGVWPTVFAPDPRSKTAPRVLPLESDVGCLLKATGASLPGVHYVETYFELEHPTDVLVAVQAAWSVLVDDKQVLSRDPRTFGVWPRFAAAVRLSAGRHRIVARIGKPETSIRVLDLSGRPIPIRASIDPTPGYSLTPPIVLADPNPLAPFLASLGHPGAPTRHAASGLDLTDPILRLAASELAAADGQHDLASVLLEPLVTSSKDATGLALSAQASFVADDAVFAKSDAHDLALDLRRRATAKDSKLWHSRMWLLLDAVAKSSQNEQLTQLSALAIEFPEVPFVGRALAELYGRLGYKAERSRTIFDLAARFPHDVEVLRLKLSAQDDIGDKAGIDATVRAIEALEPRSTIRVERAVSRGYYERAANLLEDQAASGNRAAIAARQQDLLLRAGRSTTSVALLEQQAASDPSERNLLRLADVRLKAGDGGALRDALAEAIRAGADTGAIRDAAEVVDGVSELEAYRLDPIAAVREFEKTGGAERGRQKAGSDGSTAARVVDYAALRVRPDGSARMLEHEILYMATREAIGAHAEQRIPRGKLLRMRTIKADGRTFEPEMVSGKPTATMPHLEVGDYIETETLYDLPGDGRGGRSFVGPRWFFREEKVDYERSEFIVIVPKDQPLDIETTGQVPAPTVTIEGELAVRRFRVDKSPALTLEPFSARAEEFLPTVRVGWGLSEATTLERLADGFFNVIPDDPRLVRVAQTIATEGADPAQQAAALAAVPGRERARRIYHWVLDNVEPGKETDPRRIVLGKSGSRAEAFLYLARLAGVTAKPAAVRDRLTPPPVGPISAAEQYTQLAFLLSNVGEPLWLTVGDKNAPFGYVPSAMRGQPAALLDGSLTRTKTSDQGGQPDGVTHVGEVALKRDGSAVISIEQRYTGRLAIELRTAIATLPEDRLKAAVEAKLVADAFPGGRLQTLEVLDVSELDRPLRLKMTIEASNFAKAQGNALILSPPIAMSLAPLAALPVRKTPLVIGHQVATEVVVDLSVSLPTGTKVLGLVANAQGSHGPLSFDVQDAVTGSVLKLKRTVRIPAARLAPESYPEFVEFARALDLALLTDLTLVLP